MSADNYKEFVKYYDELNDKGIPYSLGDLKRKAIELNLPLDSINDEISKFMNALNKTNDKEGECWKTKIKTAEEELEKVNDEIAQFKKTKRNIAYRNSGENLELIQLNILQGRLAKEIEFMKINEGKEEHVHDQ